MDGETTMVLRGYSVIDENRASAIFFFLAGLPSFLLVLRRERLSGNISMMLFLVAGLTIMCSGLYGVWRDDKYNTNLVVLLVLGVILAGIAHLAESFAHLYTGSQAFLSLGATVSSAVNALLIPRPADDEDLQVGRSFTLSVVAAAGLYIVIILGLALFSRILFFGSMFYFVFLLLIHEPLVVAIIILNIVFILFLWSDDIVPLEADRRREPGEKQ